MKKNINYFSTGDFAALCGVTKHTLFHYDEIRVFSPEITDENGYRYYSHWQYDTFTAIKTLRDLGMSLKDIKKYMDSRSPEKFIELVTKQEKAIDEKIKLLNHLKEVLSEKKNSVKKAISFSSLSITEEKQNNDEYLFLSENIAAIEDVNITVAISDLINKLKKAGIVFYSTIGSIAKTSDIKKSNLIYDNIYLRLLEPYIHKMAGIKKKGYYLTSYHHGYYKTIHATYKNILDYADKNKIPISRIFYEEFVIENICVTNDSDFVVKIMTKIEDSDSNINVPKLGNV